MTKITVKICSGTTCFIMGGNQLNDMAELIKTKYGDKVEITGSNCLGECSNSHSKAPFVEIDGDIISEVNAEKLITEIEKRINKDDK